MKVLVQMTTTKILKTETKANLKQLERFVSTFISCLGTSNYLLLFGNHASCRSCQQCMLCNVILSVWRPCFVRVLSTVYVM